ncbi:hypothetical protein [Mycoplasmopsis gallinarum]|uniref:Glucose-6-phosphate isomerase n=1 Tax=Mycoplasmopsis gallinarum TaxID=29557 RepID=A0A168RCP5_9BACT|nr:hypothetical protein [Mycoplasmopsis gallinarum]OAB48844.1 hypothetical protein MGALLINA_04150 [Mycoplasmopsis gallinarum]
MSNQLKLKAYNFNLNLEDEWLQERVNLLFKKMSNRNLPGYENFIFHEMYLNYNKQTIKPIKNFVKEILSYQIKDIVIFSDGTSENNFQVIESFLLNNDLLQNNRIKFHFFSNTYSTNQLIKQLKTKKSLFSNNNVLFFIISFDKFAEDFKQFILNAFKLIKNLNKITNLNQKIFYLAKENLQNEFEMFDLSKKQKFFIPSIFNSNFALLNPINLILLYLKGLNIDALITGYIESNTYWQNYEIKFNKALQFALINNQIVKNKKINLVLNNQEATIKFTKWQAFLNFNNQLNRIFPISILVNQDLQTYGQKIMENQNYFVTYFALNKELFDYQLSDELLLKDLEVKTNVNLFSNFNNLVNLSVLEVLRNVARCPIISIEIKEKSEKSLGNLIAFIYWNNIFQAYLQNYNPFTFERIDYE